MVLDLEEMAGFGEGHSRGSRPLLSIACADSACLVGGYGRPDAHLAGAPYLQQLFLPSAAHASAGSLGESECIDSTSIQLI
ncbi:unnamed protein product [Urochloa humidicola]